LQNDRKTPEVFS